MYSFLTTQSFAATELLYEGMQRTIGNLTLVCMPDPSDPDICICPEAAGLSLTEVLITSLVTATATASLGPAVKTNIIDPLWSAIIGRCSVPAVAVVIAAM